MGEPLRMVPAETLDMDVPADAEIVIEARMLPGVRELEGPFGEFSWTLGPAEMTPVAEVTAITRRHDAIFLDVFNAHPEHNLIGMIGREATVFQRVKASMPAVRAVTLPMSGTCRFTCYVSISPSHPAAGRHAALAALAADPIIKLVVVVGFLLFLAIGYSTAGTWAEIFSGFFKFGTVPVVSEGAPATENVFVSLFQGRGFPVIDLSMIGVIAAISALTTSST